MMPLARRAVALVFALLAAACSAGSGDSAAPTDPVANSPAPTPTAAPTIPPAPEPDPARAIDALALSFLRAEPSLTDFGRIIDEHDREVILRGVNHNGHAQYWEGNEYPATLELTEEDAIAMAELGWNVVRLLFSWSRVEPEPGVYDDAYLDEIDVTVSLLADHGIYTLLDSHQDAWGPTLAARVDEQCPAGTAPANGWDGAPGWATLVDDNVARCTQGGIRETSPAVAAAFDAFWADELGPGGVGIRSRYVSMWEYVVARFAPNPAVIGYDIINEPNAFSGRHQEALVELYRDAQVSIRAAETAVGAPPQLLVFEPSALWSAIGSGAPPPWDHDENVVYSPHVYPGSFTGGPLTTEPFDIAVEEARMFGGAPVFIGEWGAASEVNRGAQRVGPDGDGYFREHLDLQDMLHMSSTIWQWEESCGDPHKVPITEDTGVAGLWDVDCSTNSKTSWREQLALELTRPVPRAAPGRIAAQAYDQDRGSYELSGVGATVGAELIVFWPAAKHGDPDIESAGLEGLRVQAAPGGNAFITAVVDGAEWSLSVVAPAGG